MYWDIFLMCLSFNRSINTTSLELLLIFRKFFKVETLPSMLLLHYLGFVKRLWY